MELFKQEQVKQQQDLAAALRLAEHFGYNEGVCNHFSLQTGPDQFLLNPHGIHWSRMRASDILSVSSKTGNTEAEISALNIHAAIHDQHSHARCVLHTHMPYATSLTCLDRGRLEYVHQNSLRFYNDVAYDDDYGGLADNREEGDRIAAQMEDKRVLFLANHGIIVTGTSIADAFDRLYYLERACEVQVLAMSTGRPLKQVGDNIARKTREDHDAAGNYAEAHFTALKALLNSDYLD